MDKKEYIKSIFDNFDENSTSKSLFSVLEVGNMIDEEVADIFYSEISKAAKTEFANQLSITWLAISETIADIRKKESDDREAELHDLFEVRSESYLI